MTYRVIIVPRAKQQLAQIALWWSGNRSAEQALKWLEHSETSLQSLSSNPERCRLARENEDFDQELRELYFGSGKKFTHRAIFEIRDSDVIVYTIRHLAQADLTSDDL